MSNPGARANGGSDAKGSERESDLLGAGLLAYFLALIVIVAALLLVPVLL